MRVKEVKGWREVGCGLNKRGGRGGENMEAGRWQLFQTKREVSHRA